MRDHDQRNDEEALGVGGGAVGRDDDGGVRGSGRRAGGRGACRFGAGDADGADAFDCAEPGG
jgi:hypothetical protein